MRHYKSFTPISFIVQSISHKKKEEEKEGKIWKNMKNQGTRRKRQITIKLKRINLFNQSCDICINSPRFPNHVVRSGHESAPDDYSRSASPKVPWPKHSLLSLYLTFVSSTKAVCDFKAKPPGGATFFQLTSCYLQTRTKNSSPK